MTPLASLAGVRGILLDIEGTTTPIAFVHEILFSYARAHLKKYISEHLHSSDLLSDLETLREEHEVDVRHDLSPPPLISGSDEAQVHSIAEYVYWLMDRDRKSTGLKSLQGKIWKQGYLDETLKAQVFADVAPALTDWSRQGLSISIFSSGSVLAQKLLFAHTDADDLTGFIDNYFDTTVGSKTDAESYRRIARELKVSPEEVVFISDVAGELHAASNAGMKTLLCVRPGNQVQEGSELYQTIQSFDEISIMSDTL